MRTFAPYDKTRQGSQSGKKKERKDRTSDEWDVRIDCDATYADEIVKNIRDNEGLLKYALISGIERADNADGPKGSAPLLGGTMNWGSQDNHIHIALIFKYNLRRDQVLSICRGFFKKTDEYAVPRNKKFTYAGWYMHHAKVDWKLVQELPVRLELGVLPEDEPTDYNIASIRRLFKKFGSDDLTQSALNQTRFAKYLVDE